MIPLRHPQPDQLPQAVRSDSWQILNHLRFVAAKCRVAARTDLFQACAMLSVDKQTARDTHAHVLMRCLAQAIGKRPVLHAPGTAEVSFDESWLMRLIETAAGQDDDSFQFLLRSRVPAHARRNVAGLVRSISEQFCHYLE
ncbi:hypothetical protein [Pseudaestuariivita rosea]|uniref:hypothetical protein n=1 Tax=Pseudaestuariivita rosea TaxID=2763263 RepID=UPI001ABB33A8|nr:hypothetical protein [Pseudaestuariivita rosea]